MDPPVFAYLALGLQACTVIPFSKIYSETQKQVLILARENFTNGTLALAPFLHFYEDLIT